MGPAQAKFKKAFLRSPFCIASSTTSVIFFRTASSSSVVFGLFSFSSFASFTWFHVCSFSCFSAVYLSFAAMRFGVVVTSLS